MKLRIHAELWKNAKNEEFVHFTGDEEAEKIIIEGLKNLQCCSNCKEKDGKCQVRIKSFTVCDDLEWDGKTFEERSR